MGNIPTPIQYLEIISISCLFIFYLIKGEEYFFFIYHIVNLLGMNKESSPKNTNRFDEIKGRAVRLAPAFVDYVGNECP